MALVLLGVFLILAIWAMADPFIGLLGLVAVNTIRPGEMFPLLNTIHLERVFAIVALLSFVIHRCPIVFRPPTKAFAALWAVLLLGVPFAFWPGGALSNWIDFGRLVVYVLLIANLVNTRERFRTFLLVYSVLIGWLAVSSMVLYFMGEYEVRMGIQRAVGLTSNSDDANALGLTLVTVLPILFIQLVNRDPSQAKQNWVRPLLLALIPVCLCTIILTGSRSAFFSMLFMIAIFIFTRKRALVYFTFALVLLGTLWFVIPKQYQDRYRSVENLEADESYQGRVTSWTFAWTLFTENPITGSGMGMFPQARGARTGHWLNVHSLYFQLLSETGLLGIFAFVCYLISTYLTNRHLQAELMHIKDLPGFLIGYPLACNLCIAALLFAGWGSHSLYRETWYFLGGLSAALGGILCDLKVTVPKKKKREKSKTANMKIRALEVKA